MAVARQTQPYSVIPAKAGIPSCAPLVNVPWSRHPRAGGDPEGLNNKLHNIDNHNGQDKQ